jgi:hypothetical protein
VLAARAQLGDSPPQGDQRLLHRVSGEQRVAAPHGGVSGVAGDHQRLESPVVQAVGEGVGLDVGRGEQGRGVGRPPALLDRDGHGGASVRHRRLPSVVHKGAPAAQPCSTLRHTCRPT